MYTLTTNQNQIKRNTDGVIFSCFEGGFFYEQYKAWMAAGNTPNPIPLAETCFCALEAIDAQAEKTRLKYMTGIAGQDATYMKKAVAAAAYKAAGYPFANIANYPWVRGEARSVNQTATPTALQCQAAANGILTTEAQWETVIGPNIEEARRTGKVAVCAITVPANATPTQIAAANAQVLTAQQAAIAALAAL